MKRETKVLRIYPYQDIWDIVAQLSLFPVEIDNFTGMLIKQIAEKITPNPDEYTFNIYGTANEEISDEGGCKVAESFEALEKAGAKKLPPVAGLFMAMQFVPSSYIAKVLLYMDSVLIEGLPTIFSLRDGKQKNGKWGNTAKF